MNLQQNNLPDTFAIFILTHGRPNNVLTYRSLAACDYTGKLFFVLDDQDKTADEYREKYGSERVVVFDKEAQAAKCDSGNNFGVRKTILMARNACFQIADSLGITHFLQLDDDYEYFLHKALHDSKGYERRIKSLDRVIAKVLAFYDSSGATAIAFAQNGDFIGGIENDSGAYRFERRKCMNSFFCSTKRPFNFLGIMNEDVSAYTSLGSRGLLFLTIPNVSIKQPTTQSQAGGVTETYKLMGTYFKSFLSVMMMPSSVRVAMMQSKNPRLHHSINWGATVPKIIDQSHRRQMPTMEAAA
jgi:hypothetical protein